MERERITLKSFNTGTTFFFFSTSNDERLRSNGSVSEGIASPKFTNSLKSDVSPAYVLLDNIRFMKSTAESK